MRKLTLLALACLILSAPLVAQESSTEPWYVARFKALGFFVPPKTVALEAISFKALDGTLTGPALAKGKVSLLNFWATWCGPCRSEMPSIQTLWEKTRDLPFTIMAVDVQETVSQVKSFMEMKKFTFPAYLDDTGAPSGRYASRGIPTTYVLDKQGNILAYIVGSFEYDTPEILGLIRELCEKLP